MFCLIECHKGLPTSQFISFVTGTLSNKTFYLSLAGLHYNLCVFNLHKMVSSWYVAALSPGTEKLIETKFRFVFLSLPGPAFLCHIGWHFVLYCSSSWSFPSLEQIYRAHLIMVHRRKQLLFVAYQCLHSLWFMSASLSGIGCNTELCTSSLLKEIVTFESIVLT